MRAAPIAATAMPTTAAASQSGMTSPSSRMSAATRANPPIDVTAIPASKTKTPPISFPAFSPISARTRANSCSRRVSASPKSCLSNCVRPGSGGKEGPDGPASSAIVDLSRVSAELRLHAIGGFEMAARGGDELRVGDLVHGFDRVHMRQEPRLMLLEILDQLALGAGWSGDQDFLCRSQCFGNLSAIRVFAAK